MKADETLVEALRRRQAASGEGDHAFARRLGLSRQMWQALKRGDRQPGGSALRSITHAYPDLLPYVLALFLPSNATDANSAATDVDRREEVTANDSSRPGLP